MLVAHCKALEACGPIASRGAGSPSPAVLLLAFQGRASTAVAQRLPGCAPTTLPKKRQSVRPCPFDGIPEAGQAVGAGDENVFDAAVGEFGADSGPEFRAFVFLNPDPEHVFDSVDVHADGNVCGTIDDLLAGSDLDDESV